MTATPETLSQNIIRENMVVKEANEELMRIDEALNRSEKTWGENEVQYELPVSLNVPGVSDADIQRVMYSNIITSLERRGFLVRILLGDEKNILFIHWTSQIDEGEKRRMDEVIKTHLVRQRLRKPTVRQRRPFPSSAGIPERSENRERNQPDRFEPD